jgi:hypothetical protein
VLALGPRDRRGRQPRHPTVRVRALSAVEGFVF